jgi:hypothetical protein
MLDLDSLAERRAHSLNEGADNWHQAVWSAGFQKISASMSDGEVESLLAACRSFKQLEAVVAYLSVRQTADGPYATLVDAAKSTGKSLTDWIASISG